MDCKQAKAISDAGAAEPNPAADEDSDLPSKLDTAYARDDIASVEAIPFGRSGSQQSLAPSSKGPLLTDEGDDDSLTFFENGVIAACFCYS